MDINDILFEAMKSNASDVHIVLIPPIMRVHGRLIKLEKFGNVTPEISEKMLTGILNDEQNMVVGFPSTADFFHIQCRVRVDSGAATIIKEIHRLLRLDTFQEKYQASKN